MKVSLPKLSGSDTAILLGVYATFALDVYSTLNSSPQTTELFAGSRESTLMHWVMIGAGTAIAGGLAGTLVSQSPWPLIGAGVVAGGMFLAYRHAVDRGTGTNPPA